MMPNDSIDIVGPVSSGGHAQLWLDLSPREHRPGSAENVDKTVTVFETRRVNIKKLQKNAHGLHQDHLAIFTEFVTLLGSPDPCLAGVASNRVAVKHLEDALGLFMECVEA